MKYFQPLLPYFEEEEIRKKHKESLARRWFFGYYLKFRDDKKKMILIDQYNRLATQKERT